MKVEIWSDIMCPFCYIGKRKFEMALSQFAGRDAVEVSWRSFQLDPDLDVPAGTSIYAYLAERKGQSVAWARQVSAQVTQMAAAVGLDYQFDKAVVANSFAAHRLIHLAKTKGLDDVAEERIFRAYFTEGCDIADTAELARLGDEIGLPAAEVQAVLHSEQYAAAVIEDCAQAAQLGASGVPFFVIDRKYGIAGAQEPATFLGMLEKVQQESMVSKPLQTHGPEAEHCGIDGECP